MASTTRSDGSIHEPLMEAEGDDHRGAQSKGQSGVPSMPQARKQPEQTMGVLAAFCFGISGRIYDSAHEKIINVTGMQEAGAELHGRVSAEMTNLGVVSALLLSMIVSQLFGYQSNCSVFVDSQSSSDAEQQNCHEAPAALVYFYLMLYSAACAGLSIILSVANLVVLNLLLPAEVVSYLRGVGVAVKLPLIFLILSVIIWLSSVILWSFFLIQWQVNLIAVLVLGVVYLSVVIFVVGRMAQTAHMVGEESVAKLSERQRLEEPMDLADE